MLNKDNMVGYILCFILLFISVFNFESYAIHYSSIYYILIPMSIFVLLKSNKMNIQINHFIIICFWFLAVVSTFFSKSNYLETNLVTFFMFLISYILITSQSFSRRVIEFIVISYLFISLLVSLNIILFYFLGIEQSWGRYSLVFFDIKRDPNYVLAYIIPSYYFLLYHILFIRMKGHILEIVSLIIIIVSIFITGSRAPLLICVIITVFLFIKKFIILSNLKRAIFLLIICVFAFCLIFILRNLLNEWIFNRIFNLEYYLNDIRIQIWMNVMNSEGALTFFGHGFGAANKLSIELIGYNTHNIYLDIIYDFGILGFTMFVFLFKDFFKSKYKFEFFLLLFSFFSPLFFINGFNTVSFWLPLTFTHVIYNYSTIYIKSGTINEK